MAGTGKVSSVFRRQLFKGKVAIVTGGGTGIGKAIAQELMYLGCNVMIASRNSERLKKSAEFMKSQLPTDSDVRLEHIPCNIRKEQQVKELMRHTLAVFGRIDFLVNNGGGQFPSPAAEIRLKGWNAVIETNLTGTFLCCREVYNQWMKAHGGVIVNIIADMWKGFPGMSHTGAARAGVDNLTKSMAIEWAQDGIRINAVAPGSSIFSETAAANYEPSFFEETITFNPAQRHGTVEEISGAVCFLLSPAASFISGATLRVDSAGSLYKSGWNISPHSKLPAYSWDGDTNTNQATKSKL